MRRWNKVFQAKVNKKKSRIAILIQNNFKSKTVTRNKGGNTTVIKGSTQEDITTICNYLHSSKG